METEHYIIIGAAVVVSIALVVILRLKKKRVKTPVLPPVNVDEILQALGKQNILKVEQTQARVRIFVKDIKLVDLKALQTISKGIFTSGNKIVLTFIDKTEEIVESLRAAL